VNFKVNGNSYSLVEPKTVQELLQEYELETERVAIELNGSILDVDQFDKRRLSDGDVMEIVRFVGGG
jgi:sulfur carrier protein